MIQLKVDSTEMYDSWWQQSRLRRESTCHLQKCEAFKPKELVSSISSYSHEDTGTVQVGIEPALLALRLLLRA